MTDQVKELRVLALSFHFSFFKYFLFFFIQNIIYSNKKETSDFHGTVSFDPVKMSQQK